MSKYSKELEIAVSAALEAGDEIMDVYNNTEDINYEKKSDDSPLTIADKRSHNKIVSYLEETGINIISEESKSIEYNERRNWEEYWLVDPLDGTKEFIKKFIKKINKWESQSLEKFFNCHHATAHLHFKLYEEVCKILDTL